jgi:hypothetical protein
MAIRAVERTRERAAGADARAEDFAVRLTLEPIACAADEGDRLPPYVIRSERQQDASPAIG